MFDLSPALQATIMLIITNYLIPGAATFLGILAGIVLNKARAFLELKKLNGKLAALQSVVEVLVLAAEQTGLKSEVEELGAAKKAWVTDEVQRELNRLGLTGISADQISNAIEAAVYAQINARKQPVIAQSQLAEVKPLQITFGCDDPNCRCNTSS